MYGSSFTIATLSPRASRMAPSDAAAMPFPKEETTPPVTNTNLVMRGPPYVFEEVRIDGRAGYQSGDDDETVTGIRRQIFSSIIAAATPDQPRAPAGFDSGAHRSVQPAVPHRDEPCFQAPLGTFPGEQQRQGRALLDRKFRRLQQFLERLRARARARAQRFAALPGAQFHHARKFVEIDGAGGIVDQCQHVARIIENELAVISPIP